MTEYDYSPDAYKRHLATQEKIARWVDETLEQSPCNPFEPLPPERFTTQTPQPEFHATPEGDPTYYSNSRTHRERPTKTPQPAYHPTPEGDISPTYYSNSRTHHERSTTQNSQQAFHATPEGDASNYYSNSRTHRERSTKTPQPAFHATPDGDISPTYYSNSRTHRRNEHSQWHQNPSQQSNTPGTPLTTPQARPGFGRSFTSPTSSAGQYLPYPQYPTATPTPSRIPSPYSSRHSSRHQPSPMPHRSSSQNSFRSVHSPHHSPHIHANPVIHDGGNTYPYFSPSHPQPMQQQQQHVFVVREDSDFTVVPSPGHHVHVLVRFFNSYHVLFVVIHSIV